MEMNFWVVVICVHSHVFCLIIVDIYGTQTNSSKCKSGGW
ncbi:hypothetical protein T4C_11235 [Trichinella pseudospiralis]|uniref:Uncharacterized protein n=1 Tax=Trichinella pseudospiralis TaxID=6337 RepID=A0A0V1GTD3_TRIPS|nr:hypothetical protein T4C_11235 [Trichinella pseudospiralis]